MDCKSLHIAVNDECNSRCTMCSIWQNHDKGVFTVDSVAQFLSKSDLAEVVDLSLTGGEPFMRTDLADLAIAFAHNLPSLQMLFVNTNGTYPDRVADFVRRVSPHVPHLYGCVSIEGPEPVHNKVRGIKGYQQALRSLQAVVRAGIPNVQGIISTTITSLNRDVENLRHVKQLANTHGSTFTFRLADISPDYYGKGISQSVIPTGDFSDIIAFIEQECTQDPFLDVLKRSLVTGSVPIMVKDGQVRCKAGNAFAFINAQGQVLPCLYSKRQIAHVSTGFKPAPVPNLGSHEPCPCCTECTIYPMLNYAPHDSR